MKWFNYVCLAFVVAFFSACSDKESITGGVKEGLAASMRLSIEVPVTDKVEVTRAVNDYESEIENLILVMFAESGRKEIIDLTGKLGTSTIDDNLGHRTYTLTQSIDTKSGTYRVYAIANYDSKYCGWTKAELENMSESELKEEFAKNNGSVYKMEGTELFPMSQVLDGGDKLVLYSNEEVAEEVGENSLHLNLRRIAAHIEFEFKSSNGVTFNPYEYTVYNLPKKANLLDETTFIGAEKGDNILQNVSADDYFDIDTPIKIGGNTFGFFMLENVQAAKEGTVTNSYADRDKWIVPEKTTEDEQGAAKKKNFKNAPEFSTYVVVKGLYTGTNYVGECTYTIHLGNFGTSQTGGKFGNFNVHRNEFHKYTVTISGVSTITNEATVTGDVSVEVDGGQFPGAEGNLTKLHNTFLLDAHYERAVIKIEDGAYTALKEGNFYPSEGEGTHKVQITTPKTGRQLETVTLVKNGKKYEVSGTDKDKDIYWIKFGQPEIVDGVITIPKYPYDDTKQLGEEGGPKTIVDFLANPDLYTVEYSQTEKDESGKEVTKKYHCTVAYVDEYFYDDLLPAEFANTSDRIFVLDPRDTSTSPDEHSIVHLELTFQVSQRSIKSSFNLDNVGPFDTPYGIETWDETGGMEWVKHAGGTMNSVSEDNVSNDQGLVNTRYLLENNDMLQVNSDVWKFIGYRNPVENNTRSRHRWYDNKNYQLYAGGNHNIDYYVNSNVKSPLTGALARNRLVLTNENTVDVNSVKWYLPAVNQYLIIWMGQNRLQEDTRLMDDTLWDTWGTDSKLMDGIQHYFTSSSDDNRLYWQDQGACYGGLADWNQLNGTGKNINHIRCVRNLRTTALDNMHRQEYGDGNFYTKEHAVVFPVFVEKDTRIINCEKLENLRPNYMTGSYDYHNERSEQNRVYKRFEVADPSKGHFDSSKLNSNDKVIASESNYSCLFNSFDSEFSIKNPVVLSRMKRYAAAYYQETDKSDVGEWRVPNQRELMLMYVCNKNKGTPQFLPTYGNGNTVFSSTWFSYTNFTDRKYPFKFETRTEIENGISKIYTNYNLAKHLSGSSGVLIFVRDVK
ncbi:MAG: hypothetical protein J6C86_04815 [Bacteroidaceae bacterium]|nr:hypothetical protein [Bacteroidaceae bacterium]